MWCTDQDPAKAFYVDMLGFEVAQDVTMGEGYRWLTVRHPSQPELEVTLMTPGPPLDDDLAEAFRRAQAKGTMPGLGLATDDCRKTHAELAARGVQFIRPPTERPYGIEAIMRDDSGNWLVLVERS